MRAQAQRRAFHRVRTETAWETIGAKRYRRIERRRTGCGRQSATPREAPAPLREISRNRERKTDAGGYNRLSRFGRKDFMTRAARSRKHSGFNLGTRLAQVDSWLERDPQRMRGLWRAWRPKGGRVERAAAKGRCRPKLTRRNYRRALFVRFALNITIPVYRVIQPAYNLLLRFCKCLHTFFFMLAEAFIHKSDERKHSI